MMPGIAALARQEKAKPRKQVLKFGPQTDVLAPDYCELNSYQGCVTLGLLGVDRFTPPPGFWEKWSGRLGKIRGSKDDDSDDESGPSGSPEICGSSSSPGYIRKDPSVSPFPMDIKQ